HRGEAGGLLRPAYTLSRTPPNTIQPCFLKNSAFISFLDHFRKGSSLGKETRSPNTSTFLYSSLLYSTFLYPIASYEAICNLHFSICNPSYLPSPKPLLFSTLLYFSLPYSLLRANLQFSFCNSLLKFEISKGIQM